MWHPLPIPVIEKDIAEWLNNGQALNELLLKRGNSGDRDRVAANACANYSFEVMEYFGAVLILQLDKAKGQNDDDARRYRELLNQVGRFHWEEHLEDWLGGVLPSRKEGA